MNYTNEVDVKVEDEGTISLFRPQNAETKEWLDENTNGQWWCGALIVEHRFVRDVIEGLASNGFSTEYSAKAVAL